MKTENNTVHGGFEFGPVFAGTALALAVTVVLTQFAMAIGYTDDSPLRGEGFIASWGVIVVGVWILLTQFIASLTGGYITGRLRNVTNLYKPHEVEMRDGMHGLATWALSTLVVFFMLSMTTGATGSMLIADQTTDINVVLSDAEQNVGIVYGFIHAAMSLVAGVLSWWAATMGGEHRDGQKEFLNWSFKK